MTLTEAKLTDEDLIRKFQEGDESAYEEIVERYSRQLYSFIRGIIKDPMYADDLLQETFIRLYQNKNSYREIARFSTWIYTIAGNLAKTELRRQKIRRWFSLSGSGDDDRPLELPTNEPDPLTDVERSDKMERIRTEIDNLPRVFREVIYLRDVQELSYEEIGTILGIPLGTVKSRVNRGRLRLQRHLKDLLL